MAARIARVRVRKTVFDLWGFRPSMVGASPWEKYVPIGLDIDTGFGGYIWFGWCWSGQVCLYVDRY